MNDDTSRTVEHAPTTSGRVPRETPDAASALRVLPTLAGSALLLLGLRRRGDVGRLASLAGAGLLAHGIAPVLLETVIREGAARRRFELDLSMAIDRAVPVVFAFCTDFSNFPSLVRQLVEVKDFGDGRSHWVARDIDGSLVEWDAMVTKFVPNQVIAWESDASAPVEGRGVIRFQPLGPDRTDLSIHLFHQPKRTTLKEALFALTAPPRGQVIARDLSLMTRLLDEYDPTVEPAPPQPMIPVSDAGDSESA